MEPAHGGLPDQWVASRLMVLVIGRSYVHTPLKKYSMTTANGVWRTQESCSGSPCQESLGDALAVTHGFALNLDGIGVVDNPVTDDVSQVRIIQVLVPFAGVILRTEDGGRPPRSKPLPVPMHPTPLPP